VKNKHEAVNPFARYMKLPPKGYGRAERPEPDFDPSRAPIHTPEDAPHDMNDIPMQFRHPLKPPTTRTS